MGPAAHLQNALSLPSRTIAHHLLQTISRSCADLAGDMTLPAADSPVSHFDEVGQLCPWEPLCVVDLHKLMGAHMNMKRVPGLFGRRNTHT
jgi:hypothetical protein